ncbi:MAG: DUF4249 domain-containing protein [Rufibacter sp.]
MKKLLYHLYACLACLALAGCVEEYALPESASNLNLLVVNGNLNVEQGTGTVQLSRTQNLSEASKVPLPETKASVTVESDTQQKYKLWEITPGKYLVTGLSLQYGKEYRLLVRTLDGKEYVSNLVSSSKTPAIGALSWEVVGNNVQVKVSTQDPENTVKYFRWEYQETYEYNSQLPSLYKFENDEVVPRGEHEKIQVCWKQQASNSILVNSTAQLSQSIINDFVLVSQSGGADLFSKRYSILVKQYGISQAEYDYWRMLQKNTEAVGTLFDAQPAYVTGNLTCVTNPEEPVFGYFSVQSVSEKRIFIDASELKAYTFQREPLPFCEPLKVTKAQLPQYEKTSLVIDIDESGPVPLYIIAKNECIDCRVKGGNTLKPDFW